MPQPYIGLRPQCASDISYARESTKEFCAAPNSDVEGDGEGVDVDTAMSLMEDTDLVRRDDDQDDCFIFDQSNVLVMVRPPSSYACASRFVSAEYHLEVRLL